MSNELQKPEHSPLGASSAERWLNCPGSIALLKKLKIGQTDEPEYRGLGVAAHELGAHCLAKGTDAWEHIGEKFHDLPVDKEMADAVQVYLDTVRPAFAQSGVKTFIEYGISHPAHDLFYGTLDFAAVYGDTAEINDYKHGQGIVVEVEDNPQLKYYAYGFIREFAEIKTVILRIIQPRTYREAVRTWIVDADSIRKWAEETLIPAMHMAEMDGGDLLMGDWCRFCPAKLVCPKLTQLFGAAANANPKSIVDLSNESLGRNWGYIQAVKFYIKALEDEVYARLQRGKPVEGCKLVPKRANRVWKTEASEILKQKFGEEAYTKPGLKSPAEIDKLGATGKQFTMEFAFTPQAGLTVALETDDRIGVKMQSTADTFGAALEKINA